MACKGVSPLPLEAFKQKLLGGCRGGGFWALVNEALWSHSSARPQGALGQLYPPPRHGHTSAHTYDLIGGEAERLLIDRGVGWR